MPLLPFLTGAVSRHSCLLPSRPWPASSPPAPFVLCISPGRLVSDPVRRDYTCRNSQPCKFRSRSPRTLRNASYRQRKQFHQFLEALCVRPRTSSPRTSSRRLCTRHLHVSRNVFALISNGFKGPAAAVEVFAVTGAGLTLIVFGSGLGADAGKAAASL